MAKVFYHKVSYMINSQLTLRSEGPDKLNQNRENYENYSTLYRKFVPSIVKEALICTQSAHYLVSTP